METDPLMKPADLDSKPKGKPTVWEKINKDQRRLVI